MSIVVRDTEGRIIDKLHRSIPFVTKYEKARIFGERTRQLNSGAIPFIVFERNIIKFAESPSQNGLKGENNGPCSCQAVTDSFF
jgi:hypothetical protein